MCTKPIGAEVTLCSIPTASPALYTSGVRGESDVGVRSLSLSLTR